MALATMLGTLMEFSQIFWLRYMLLVKYVVTMNYRAVTSILGFWRPTKVTVYVELTSRMKPLR